MDIVSILRDNMTPDQLESVAIWTEEIDGHTTVGCKCFNPLTDSYLILSINDRFQFKIKDHDGSGENQMPWFWDDIVSDPDLTDKDIIVQALSFFMDDVKRAYEKFANGILV